MRSRWLLLVGLACLAAAVPAASAAGAPAAPVVQLRDYNCLRATDPLVRAMSVTAVMRPLTGTESMRVRFDLLRSAHRFGVYRTVRGKNLGDWLSPPDPTLGQRPDDVWVVPHPIVGLPAPAFYRLRVTFRWLGTGGRRLDQQVRLTPLCHQLELRPDVVAGSLQVFSLAAQPGQYAYVVQVRDRGLTGAGPFDVQLAIPGSPAVTKTIAWLGSHRGKSVRFVAPACTAGSQLTATADPGGAVEDYDRSNNVLTALCPASPPGYTG